MAINVTKGDTFHGDRKNRKQGIFSLPAQASANKPACINLQSVSGTTVTDRWLFINDAGTSLMLHTAKPTTSASDGTAIGGVATLDAAYDASASPGTGIIDGSNATGAGNCIRIGGAATLDKVEIFHDGSNATIQTMADDLYLAAAGGNINFSGDNIAGAGSITGTSADIITGELTCGSINRAAGTLLLEIAGTPKVSIAAATITLGGNLDVNTTGEVTCGSINRASGSLTLEIAGTAVATATSTAFTLAQNLDVNTTGEVTAGSINRASGSLTLEIAGVAQQTITNTETTLAGNIILPSGGTITSAGTDIDFGAEDLVTTGNIHLDADGTASVGRLKLGDAGTSYIEDDGSTLNFYDTTSGPYTLNELATGTTLNPTLLSGSNLTIIAGNFTWTNDAAAETAVWTLAATTVDGIQIESSNTTADVIQVTADGTANGRLLVLDADGGVGATGEYIQCVGTGNVFTVGEFGATTIAGSASGTDALTLTAGDIKVTSGLVELTLGNVLLTNGMVTIDTVQAITSYIKRNNATTTTPVFEIEETHVDADNPCLLVDHNPTGAVDAVQITHDSTGYGLSVVGTAATGGQLFLDGPASQTERMIDVVGTWIGKADEGMIDITNASALLAGANLLRIDSSGANAAASHALEIIVSGNVVGATLGTALNITDTGTVAGTSYAAYVNSSANSALNLVTGAVATSNLVCTGVAAQTSSMVLLDGTTGTGWDGADGVGLLEIQTLIQNHAGATCLMIDTEAAPIAAAEGACARFIQSGGAAVTDGYLVQIAAITTGGALHVDTGFSVFDETVNVAGGYLISPTTLTTDNTDGNETYSAAEMLGGFIIRGAGDELTGDRTDVTATGTQIVAAIPGCVTGASFDLYVKNEDSTHDVIISAGADVTLVGGNITVDSDEMVHLKGRVTNAAGNTVSIYNFGIRGIAQT